MTKPRIQVSVKTETKTLFHRMAQLTNATMSGVAGDLLDSMAPQLTNVVALLEAAQEAPKEMQLDLYKALDDIEMELVGAAGSANAKTHRAITRAGSKKTASKSSKKSTKKVSKKRKPKSAQ